MSEAPQLELPVLHSGELDEAGLDRLFDDLAAHAQVDEVRVKGGPTRHAGDDALDLAAARAQLSRGAHGVQVRYRFDGADWFDTVLRAANGFRVIRMRAPAEPGG